MFALIMSWLSLFSLNVKAGLYNLSVRFPGSERSGFNSSDNRRKINLVAVHYRLILSLCAV